jgi:molybdopterin/thiamine biosynthesis adenylyltransferase/rhodanese-related sulfurtransferase
MADAERGSGAARLPELTPAEALRYARHMVLDDVGEEGQRRLKAAKVLLVGAGGLGSPASLYLAAAGVGTLGLVDFDDVDPSNLQRQVLYGEGDLGKPKLDAAMARLRDLNPHITIVPHSVRLTSDNALDIIRAYDIVVDGTDNFPTRYLVNDACVILGKRNVYGSILKFEGQVSVFGGDEAPCYRCLFRQPPPPGLVPTCAEGGVLGVLPGIIGSLQALETVKLITGMGDPLIGRLLLFDGAKLKWRELKLRKNPECPACGEQPTVTELIDYEEFCGLKPERTDGRDDAAETLEPPETPGTPDLDDLGPEIGAAELKARLDAGVDLDLIDVREPYEWTIFNLEDYGAELIPLNQLQARLGDLDKEREIVFYCRSGARSGDVTRYLRQHGWDRARNLTGGILAWGDEVDPDTPRY